MLSKKDAMNILERSTTREELRCRGNVYCALETVQVGPKVRVIDFFPVVRERQPRSRIAGTAKLKKMRQRRAVVDIASLRKSLMNPGGVHEDVFHAARGIITIVGEDVKQSTLAEPCLGPMWCGSRHIVVANPFDACGALQNEERMRNAIVIARRGGCFFSSKAVHVQYAGGAAIIVVDSPREELSLPMRMPAAEDDAHLVKIPAVMVTHEGGEALLRASKSGKRLVFNQKARTMMQYVQKRMTKERRRASAIRFPPATRPSMMKLQA